jgi:hypothetical protein
MLQTIVPSMQATANPNQANSIKVMEELMVEIDGFNGKYDNYAY